MSTVQECIDKFRLRERTRPPGTPIRIIRAATLTTQAWRSDEQMMAGKGSGRWRGGQRAIVREMAEAGEHLGLDRVGLVIETTTEIQP